VAGPVLETARLILRPPVEADFADWAALMADPEATRFLGGPLAVTAGWRALATHAGVWSLRGYGMFSVVERATGRWIGRIGPWLPPDWPGPEIGWALARPAWGNGFAYEGATAAIDWAFDVLGWTEIIHCINPENFRSAALAARLGSTNRGPGRLPAPHADEPVDIWGQTAATWRRRMKTAGA